MSIQNKKLEQLRRLIYFNKLSQTSVLHTEKNYEGRNLSKNYSNLIKQKGDD